MIEGIFGTILTSIYTIIYSIFDKNPFKDIVKYYNNEINTKFILLIIFLVLYLFLSGGRNAYRVATNKIYSPMAKSLTDYCLNPLLIIYYFIFAGDFKVNEEKQYILFIFNFILSIIIVFCALVYNELLILVCYNLEYNTHREVSIRANTKENIEMEENQDGTESDGEKDDNNSDDS